mmetsp:Transcript_42087/g.61744  ORF Transcript_42087/g.61744 Transcript_42087/m.61744 type:complete len:200 (+) Transcript_42087:263-862(+)
MSHPIASPHLSTVQSPSQSVWDNQSPSQPCSTKSPKRPIPVLNTLTKDSSLPRTQFPPRVRDISYREPDRIPPVNTLEISPRPPQWLFLSSHPSDHGINPQRQMSKESPFFSYRCCELVTRIECNDIHPWVLPPICTMMMMRFLSHCCVRSYLVGLVFVLPQQWRGWIYLLRVHQQYLSIIDLVRLVNAVVACVSRGGS